jgi:hypothetical protein
MPQHQENVFDDGTVEDVLSKNEAVVIDSDAIKQGALSNKEFEDQLSFLEALKKYRKAVFLYHVVCADNGGL